MRDDGSASLETPSSRPVESEPVGEAAQPPVCPFCASPLTDLRGAGFNREQAEGCFAFNVDEFECHGYLTPEGKPAHFRKFGPKTWMVVTSP